VVEPLPPKADIIRNDINELALVGTVAYGGELLGQKDRDTSPEHYRTRAAQMLKLAVEVPDEELRSTLLGLAASWEKLAQQAEKPVPAADLVAVPVADAKETDSLDQR
jgi:hypothetical protein